MWYFLFIRRILILTTITLGFNYENSETNTIQVWLVHKTNSAIWFFKQILIYEHNLEQKQTLLLFQCGKWVYNINFKLNFCFYLRSCCITNSPLYLNTTEQWMRGANFHKNCWILQANSYVKPIIHWNN